MRILSVVCTFLFAVFSIACSPAVEFPKEGPTAMSKDFMVVEGAWQGTLTYADYSSGNKVVIKSDVTVDPISANQIEYTVSYPDEPWEDSQSVFEISAQGRLLDGHVVSERQVDELGGIILTTLHKGLDDNRPAEIRQTYGLNANRFYIRKEVKFENEETYLFRNIYEFTR